MSLITKLRQSIRLFNRRRLDKRQGRRETLPYAQWIQRFDTVTPNIRAGLIQRMDKLPHRPLVSVIMPVYNPPLKFLQEAIESVQRQIYPHWEFCIADDCSTDPNVLGVLRAAEKSDPRIKLIVRETNGHISAASNSALQMASGEWIALLDHDDVLAEHALLMMVLAIEARTQARLFYSDEDKIREDGVRERPHFKPDWNLEKFRAHNYICHLCVIHKALVDKLGGFRLGVEGAQDHDLFARCIETLVDDQIVHIPHILYHWRTHPGSTAKGIKSKPYSVGASVKVLEDHLTRVGLVGSVEPDLHGLHVHYAIAAPLPLVSIIIPTRNGRQLLQTCIESIQRLTSYPSLELLIVDNGSDDGDALAYLASLQKLEHVTVIADPSPFNYAALNNQAAALAKGSVLAFLNNDIEVIEPRWLDEMVSLALRPDVGCVGAKLLFGDGSIQHCGVTLGMGEIAGHPYRGSPRDRLGYWGRLHLRQDVSAVTGACLVMRRDAFHQLNGFDAKRFGIDFNDVDLCLRAKSLGLRNVWTPHAVLYHHESMTRVQSRNPSQMERFQLECEHMAQAWGHLLRFDPAYNPNLSLTRGSYELAEEPRVRLDGSAPWEILNPMRPDVVEQGH